MKDNTGARDRKQNSLCRIPLLVQVVKSSLSTLFNKALRALLSNYVCIL